MAYSVYTESDVNILLASKTANFSRTIDLASSEICAKVQIFELKQTRRISFVHVGRIGVNRVVHSLHLVAGENASFGVFALPLGVNVRFSFPMAHLRSCLHSYGRPTTLLRKARAVRR